MHCEQDDAKRKKYANIVVLHKMSTPRNAYTTLVFCANSIPNKPIRLAVVQTRISLYVRARATTRYGICYLFSFKDFQYMGICATI